MGSLKPGDIVLCRVRHSKIVAPSSTKYDEDKTFEVLSSDESGYFLHVPEHYGLRGTIEITSSVASSLNILPRYIGSHLIFILGSYIAGVRSVLDGCLCIQCGEFYPFAQPNRGDGMLVCWACRSNPYR
jgi:hypothetical protein